MNIHCGKHDKIFDSAGVCPGCDYAAKNPVIINDSTIKGPDDTLAELRGVSDTHKNVWSQMVEKISGKRK